MKYQINGHKLIIIIDYLNPFEPLIPKRPLKIPVSNSFQGMRTDFAYEKVFIIENALRKSKKKGMIKSGQKT